jgi:hypothetical protein
MSWDPSICWPVDTAIQAIKSSQIIQLYTSIGWTMHSLGR